MILTKQDLLNSGKYKECEKCFSVHKNKKMTDYHGQNLCHKCLNGFGTIGAFKRAGRRRLYHKPSQYSYLYRKLIDEGLSRHEANKRIKAIKVSSANAHKLAKEQEEKKSFAESFEELIHGNN